MDLSVDLGTLLSNIPSSLSLIVTLSMLVFGFWIKNKTADSEEKNTNRAIQTKQVESLIQQIQLLSDELDKTRKQLSELHGQNIDLMGKLRDANRRISDLESTLSRAPCRGNGPCPNLPPVPNVP